MAKEPLRQDIQEAADRMPTKVGVGKELKKLAGHLTDGETVHELVLGQYGPSNGLVVLTDGRILFVSEKLLSSRSEDVQLSRVTSVGWESGKVFGSITVHAAGQTVEIKSVEKGAGRRFVDRARMLAAN